MSYYYAQPWMGKDWSNWDCAFCARQKMPQLVLAMDAVSGIWESMEEDKKEMSFSRKLDQQFNQGRKSMILKTPEAKTVVWQLISQESEVDAEGKPVPRKSFPKSLLKGVREIREKVLGGIEIGIQGEDGIVWVKHGDVQPGMKAVAERHTDVEIELSPAAEAAVRQFYREADHLPLISE